MWPAAPASLRVSRRARRPGRERGGSRPEPRHALGGAGGCGCRPATLPLVRVQRGIDAAPRRELRRGVVSARVQFMADKRRGSRNAPHAGARGRLLMITRPPNAFFEVLDGGTARHVSDEAAAFLRMVFTLNETRSSSNSSFRAPDSGRYPLVRRASRCACQPHAISSGSTVHCTPLTGLLSPRGPPARIAALQDDVVPGMGTIIGSRRNDV